MSNRKIVLIDFDGVLHSYKSGWCGIDNIPDPPVPEALNFLRWLYEENSDLETCIYSSRSSQERGIEAMRTWFSNNGLEQEVIDALSFPTQKPAAFITIDDRCFSFVGKFPSIAYIKSFKSWYE